MARPAAWLLAAICLALGATALVLATRGGAEGVPPPIELDTTRATTGQGTTPRPPARRDDPPAAVRTPAPAPPAPEPEPPRPAPPARDDPAAPPRPADPADDDDGASDDGDDDSDDGPGDDT
jgi:hypothetical protein